MNQGEIMQRKREMARQYDEVYNKMKGVAKGSPEHLALLKEMDKIDKRSHRFVLDHITVFRKIRDNFWYHLEELGVNQSNFLRDEQDELHKNGRYVKCWGDPGRHSKKHSSRALAAMI